MKLEIEITEAEIRSAMERKVRTAIADKTNEWGTDNFIKEMVKKHWQDTVEAMVVEHMKDIPTMQDKIRAAIEAKLKGQLTAMMKVKV